MYYEINGNILPRVRLVDRAFLEPPYVHKKRQADEYILYVMKKGILYLNENGTDYELEEGNVILLDPDFVHQGIQASECEYYYIHFRHPDIRRRQEDDDFWKRCLEIRGESLKESSSSYDRYRDSWLQFPKVTCLSIGKSSLRVTALLEKAMEHNCNRLENYKVSCGCEVMEALVEIARQAVTTSVPGQLPGIPDSYKKVHELLSYLNTNYQEQIDSRLIEERFSCNFDYLNRVFKKNIGKTIFVYLNETRIQRARELLGTTSMKVSAVGYRVGFPDESYFSKVFKKYTGMPPARYEKYASQSREGSSV